MSVLKKMRTHASENSFIYVCMYTCIIDSINFCRPANDQSLNASPLSKLTYQ